MDCALKPILIESFPHLLCVNTDFNFSFLPLEQELTSFKKNKHIIPLVYLSYDLTQHDGGAAMLPSKCTTCSVSVLRLMTESTAL